MPHAILLAYKLYEPDDRYDSFFAAIDELSDNDHIEIFDGCTIAKFTGSSAMAYRKKLLPLLGQHDRLFICQVDDTSCAGRLFPRERTWIKEHLFWASRSEEHVDIPHPRWGQW